MTNRGSSQQQDEHGELAELEVLFAALRFALERQRLAIANLDTDELAHATAEQRRIADELALVQQTRAPRGEKRDPAQQELARLAIQLRCVAQSNAALLGDARRMIGHVLGTETATGGYDRRARRASEPRHAVAKAV